MKRKNILLRNGLHLALLGAALALGAQDMALADNATIDTEQNENIPAGKHGDPIELDPIVAIGRMPASTVVLGREADTPSNRRVQDVLKGMPNILDNSEANGVYTIRGIEGSDPPDMIQNLMTANRPRANTLVDGVARPVKGGSSVSTSSLSGLWDVETVEVAKGPQTTTTGRSSLTGAVNVSTRDPVHEWEAALRAGYFTEHKNVESAVMMNLPLIKDQVALRFAAEGSDGEHYVDFSNHPYLNGAAYGDELDDDQYEHYRGKLLLTPDALPDTELVFNINKTRAQGASRPGVEDWRADDLVTDGLAYKGFDNEQKVYSVKLLQGLGEKMDLEVQVSYLDNTYQVIRSPYLINGDDLKPVNSRRSNSAQWVFDTDTTSAEALLHFEELGLIDKGRVGVAYEYEKDNAKNPAINYNGAGRSFAYWASGDKENFAILGEIEAGIGGGFTAIAGGRFEWDERKRGLERLFHIVFGGKDDEARDEVDDEAFSPKIGIRYDGADNYVAGYTYSEGYRPGGVDLYMTRPTIPITTFKDERLKNHEIWLRSNPADRLSLNASVFYYEFDDMQLRLTCPDFTGEEQLALFTGYACQTGNIPEAEGYGMELDGQYAIDDPWRNTWTISGALGLLETEVNDAGPDFPEYEGREMSQSPDITWNLGLGWVSPRGFDAEISARHVGSFQQSHIIYDGNNNQYYDETDSYTLFDLKAGYETEFRGTELRIDAWVENLTDRRYKLPGYSPTRDLPGRPRTFGVAVSARF
uniref:Outer membrane receptor proteins, mostly Fe transport n=1 Tax=Candidatus Kentrum sp. FW TaxID=2126338 RepID=A0A450TYX6_9GAMM|nr:MAG: Outer membrane receptor proteins, mostly Fe transport [Candidatus Kentron sp. FW]